ncbi:helix-turn-helix domain-containing protein [Mycolicibacterium sp. 018/SC-01/001]|uniref:helix-turn-helix domain-containing protein n=1 Tax=Mycolicibacterium sp. 018/SC-01/001 TaxID=2592069 RepID=UPI00117D9E10|nr:helix-turn-helix domain-containing protein [Mycolicibacterium sp. 018/SC-01/001]TRW85585.1 helix-turn-helix domain-containing protein [Mycolicibacterium sp. 018/SC-01/001]
MHTVAILAYDGMTGFETGLAAEIFGITELNEKFSAGITRPWYTVQLCAETPEVRLLGGATVRTAYGLAELADADTVLIPSVGDIEAPVSPALVEALQAADRRGARLVSICSGAFALAEAGVLDGRSATTHWLYADAMARRYPNIEIDRAPLYVDNGRVLTSAGCAAGLDLCLHIVRTDHGVAAANDVARRLVIAPHRAGGQAQYIETPVPEPAADGRIAAGMAWALENLDTPITLDDLAAQCAMSRRNFLRQFAKATGSTPIKWLIEQRVLASLPLLESSALSVEQVSARVGFESPVTFRYHFVRQMHTTPSEYRSCFAGSVAL